MPDGVWKSDWEVQRSPRNGAAKPLLWIVATIHPKIRDAVTRDEMTTRNERLSPHMRTPSANWDQHLILLKRHTSQETIVNELMWLIMFHSCEPGSSVSIVSGHGLDDQTIDFRSPAEAKGFFLYPLCPDQLWGPPSLLYNGYRGSFPRC
jgi:hypothetical protein